MINHPKHFQGGSNPQPKSTPVVDDGFPFMSQDDAKIGIDFLAMVNLNALSSIFPNHIADQFL
jgi:hypothetical protein